MIIQNLLYANESYTHDNWVYRDVNVTFSRLYYIMDGEAYYEEDGKAVRLKKNHVYLTPVKRCFTLYENPDCKLLHTYAHITTVPHVTRFTEVSVEEGSLLADAVSLWRKYTLIGDMDQLHGVIQFLLSCLEHQIVVQRSLAERTRDILESRSDFSIDMKELCRTLGYSREHITRVFCDTYRTTPKQYLALRRMRTALEHLERGAAVSEVAYLVGYASCYSFSKAFKLHYGLSPEKYLRTLHAQENNVTE